MTQPCRGCGGARYLTAVELDPFGDAITDTQPCDICGGIDPMHESIEKRLYDLIEQAHDEEEYDFAELLNNLRNVRRNGKCHAWRLMEVTESPPLSRREQVVEAMEGRR